MSAFNYYRRYRNEEGIVLSRNYFKESGQGRLFPTLYCDLPEQVVDLDSWLRQTFNLGEVSWSELSDSLQLPSHRLWQIPPGEIIPQPLPPPSGELRLLSALMLARCNSYGFDPHSPYIFTRNRLQRKIQLIHLSAKDFYELDCSKY
jgi:hypothetical protein